MGKARNKPNSRQSKDANPIVKRALWTPQPGPQANAIGATWCPLIFYGGGKFSGKTDFLLGDYLQDIETYREHWQGIVFRRNLTEFTEMKLRASELCPQIGGIWYQQASEWRFPRYGNGITHPVLRFRYLEDLRDIRLYEGHSYPWIGVDELGDWEDENAFFRLFTLNRYGRAPIPTKRIRATGNPGGRGHLWIKRYFVDPAPLGSKIHYDDRLGIKYLFILGTYRDNKIGIQNDPDVPNRMNRAGSPALVRALKEGDFNVVAGAFFTFDQRHITPPHEIPQHWIRFMSMDYGSAGDADPFSIGWWTVSDGGTYDDIPSYPRGHIIRYREWYGRGHAKVDVKDLADGIKSRELPTEKISYRVAGGDIEQKRDKGPSFLEQFSNEGLIFQRADMRRKVGWMQLNGGLAIHDGRSKITVFSTCRDSIQTMPTIQHDIKDAQDIEEGPNDHIPDEWRYACMSRPWSKDPPKPKTPPVKSAISFNELLEQNEFYD